MRILRLKTALGPDALRKALDDLDAVAIRPGVAESVTEFELASHLAKGSFEKKTNIARKLRYEFLLWLSGKTDIKSAMKETWPGDMKGGFIIAVFSDGDSESTLRILNARELPLGLKKTGEQLALERISLSRAGK
ncbi:hypothetical protein L0Y65_00305 [Candidatus Micrarchaeota archaeon]|nr:hypothetical protein [Candidatus Micrarchaeota archaeon]